MSKDERTKLHGSTATYLQEMTVDRSIGRISETYECDLDELARTYSDPKHVPIRLNLDKRTEIAFLARAYLELKEKSNDRN